MMSDWTETTLGEICANQKGSIQTGPFGSQLHTSDYREIGTPVVMPTNIGDGRIEESGIARIGQEDVNRLSQHIFRKGDIVFSRRGDVTKNALVRDRETGWFCGTGCLKVRIGDESIALAEFISQYLRLPAIKEWLVRHAVGATMPNLNTGILSAVPVMLPSLIEQKKIAKILNGFDEKIKLNSQTNLTLEQMAQAIFKSWFVYFEPTRAKIAAKLNGQDPERAAMAVISGKTVAELEQLSPDTQQQLRTTAALFPDKLVDSELGEIPEGWDVGNIGSIVNAKGGYAFKGNSFVEEGNPVVKIKNITGDGRVDLKSTVCIDDEQAKKAERFKLSDGDLLMAMTGATVGKIGFVVTEGKSIYLNQRVAKFESEKFGKQISWFLYCCLQRDSIFDSVVGAAYGSAQPNISSSVIESIEFVVPHHDLIFNFCEFAESLFNKWISNINENSLLEESRDSLLPKLLSGELAMGEGE
jgi:type I restriction enzyme S subunit